MKHVPHTYTVQWACIGLHRYWSLRAKEEMLADYHRHEPALGTCGPQAYAAMVQHPTSLASTHGSSLCMLGSTEIHTTKRLLNHIVRTKVIFSKGGGRWVVGGNQRTAVVAEEAT